MRRPATSTAGRLSAAGGVRLRPHAAPAAKVNEKFPQADAKRHDGKCRMPNAGWQMPAAKCRMPKAGLPRAGWQKREAKCAKC